MWLLGKSNWGSRQRETDLSAFQFLLAGTADKFTLFWWSFPNKNDDYFLTICLDAGQSRAGWLPSCRKYSPINFDRTKQLKFSVLMWESWVWDDNKAKTLYNWSLQSWAPAVRALLGVGGCRLCDKHNHSHIVTAYCAVCALRCALGECVCLQGAY